MHPYRAISKDVEMIKCTVRPKEAHPGNNGEATGKGLPDEEQGHPTLTPQYTQQYSSPHRLPYSPTLGLEVGLMIFFAPFLPFQTIIPLSSQKKKKKSAPALEKLVTHVN